ncbi:MAG: threonine-phosphate decarboxylase CobD [Pseudomonadota bacterium]
MSEILHGGRLDAAIMQYGGEKSEWLDLSTGINPNAYPVPEFSQEVWSRLPDQNAERKMLDAARKYYGVNDQFEIVAAPGTQALIQLLPNIDPARDVSILVPTYGEHAHVWRSAGARVREVQALDALKPGCALCVVVNPNNPDACVRTASEICRAAEMVTSMVVDEAFCDVNRGETVVACQPSNVFVLKSFGKFFGLAGLRLGFAICNAEIGKKVRNALGPWSVSGPAMALATQAFEDENWVLQTRDRLGRDSNDLATLLEDLGFSVEGNSGLFVYIHHHQSEDVFDWLAKHKILVRPFPERPGFLRFGLHKDTDELNRLADVLTSYVARV